MLQSPEVIQRQLSDAISVIGREDFPEKWPNLLSELVEKFGTGDFNVINGILQTAHSLFKRYRYEFKSEELWKEIKFVLENFAAPLTQLSIVSCTRLKSPWSGNVCWDCRCVMISMFWPFQALMGLTKQYENDKNALKVVYNSILMVMKIFNSLNCQVWCKYWLE